MRRFFTPIGRCGLLIHRTQQRSRSFKPKKVDPKKPWTALDGFDDGSGDLDDLSGADLAEEQQIPLLHSAFDAPELPSYEDVLGGRSNSPTRFDPNANVDKAFSDVSTMYSPQQYAYALFPSVDIAYNMLQLGLLPTKSSIALFLIPGGRRVDFVRLMGHERAKALTTVLADMLSDYDTVYSPIHRAVRATQVDADTWVPFLRGLVSAAIYSPEMALVVPSVILGLIDGELRGSAALQGDTRDRAATVSKLLLSAACEFGSEPTHTLVLETMRRYHITRTFPVMQQLTQAQAQSDRRKQDWNLRATGSLKTVGVTWLSHYFPRVLRDREAAAKRLQAEKEITTPAPETSIGEDLEEDAGPPSATSSIPEQSKQFNTMPLECPASASLATGPSMSEYFMSAPSISARGSGDAALRDSIRRQCEQDTRIEERRGELLRALSDEVTQEAEEGGPAEVQQGLFVNEARGLFVSVAEAAASGAPLEEDADDGDDRLPTRRIKDVTDDSPVTDDDADALEKELASEARKNRRPKRKDAVVKAWLGASQQQEEEEEGGELPVSGGVQLDTGLDFDDDDSEDTTGADDGGAFDAVVGPLRPPRKLRLFSVADEEAARLKAEETERELKENSELAAQQQRVMKARGIEEKKTADAPNDCDEVLLQRLPKSEWQYSKEHRPERRRRLPVIRVPTVEESSVLARVVELAGSSKKKPSKTKGDGTAMKKLPNTKKTKN